VSVQSKLLFINHKIKISINIYKNESDNISVVQNESFISCQLRDTYLYNTYMMMIVVAVVVVKLVI